MNTIIAYLVTVLRHGVHILRAQIRDDRDRRKARPHIRAFQHPHMVHHLALLLVTVLALLLGWPLFLSTLPHIPLACIGYQ